MNDSKKIIEHIKSIMIAVLFITALLLLSFFWSDGGGFDRFAKAFQDDDDAYSPEISELIRPEQIVVNFGSETYTILDAEWPAPEYGLPAWTEASQGIQNAEPGENDNYASTEYDYVRSLMALYLNQNDISHEKISEEQYEEVMSYPSIEVIFGYDIPFRDYLENGQIKLPAGSNDISNISRFAFSTASSENLFIYDSGSDSYYRFVTGNEKLAAGIADELSGVIEGIESAGMPFYYTLNNIAGIESNTLIPLSSDVSFGTANCRSELSISNSSEISRYEDMFFPSGLDFVRKITENQGTLLYSYGYSQKVLTLDESGSISYKEEIDSTQYSEVGFYDGLNTAVQYVFTHGGWTLMKGEGMRPYLKHAERISSEDGRYNGYRYEFGIKLYGIPVTYSSGSIIDVDIYGVQVTSYNRDMISVDGVTGEGASHEIISAIDVITDEYTEIATTIDNMKTEAVKEGEQEEIAADTMVKEDRDENIIDEYTFERVAGSIDHIELCMLRDTMQNRMVIIPAWHIVVEGVDFWCSTEDGHIMASAGEVR